MLENSFHSVKKRILVIDDHAVVREGLKTYLEKSGEFVVCGEAAEGRIALETMQTTRPDAIVVDVRLKDMNGLEVIKLIRIRDSHVPILVMSMYDETIYAERSFRAGANGYIMKEESIDRVVFAIKRILSGKTYMSQRMADIILDYFPGTSRNPNDANSSILTDRELEVFRMIGQGHSKSQIANELSVSTKTVDSYREQIKSKLNLNSSTELLKAAIHWANKHQMN